MWAHLEEVYGPTSVGACDDAIARTRGMPLAMRREYARAAIGGDAWSIEQLDDASRAAVEVAAVLRLPAAPAAIAALIPDVDAEGALADLVARQLLDPVADGRFGMHDIVRAEVLACMDDAGRASLERAAAELTFAQGRSQSRGRRPLHWEVRDGAALGLSDPVDRMREGVRHLVAAGAIQEAVDRVVDSQDLLARRGCGGEVLALIDGFEGPTARQRQALDRVRADICARHGQVAAALEIAERLPAGRGVAGALRRVTAAGLAYRAGDVMGALAVLRGLADHDDVEVRGLAAAQLVDIELARGKVERACERAVRVLEADRAKLSVAARVHLGVALGAAQRAAGRITAARVALSRAASAAGNDAVLAARVSVELARCLVSEGGLPTRRLPSRMPKRALVRWTRPP